MIKINNYTRNLIWMDGIYIGKNSVNISYPLDGSNNCFQIEDDSFWFKHRNNIILNAMKRYSISGPIFDVGGGNGNVSLHLQRNGFDTILVEPRLDGCNNARSRNINTIINSAFTGEFFKSDSINNIGIFDVIEHIENQLLFLNEINKALVKNGILFITVPAFRFLWSHEDVDAGHYRRYRSKEFNKILNSLGFKVIFSTYFFSFLILPILFFRTLPSKLGFYKTHFEQTQKQHLFSNRMNVLLNRLVSHEINKIEKGNMIKIGSSYLIVAQKL